MQAEETYEVHGKVIWGFLIVGRNKNASTALQVGVDLKKKKKAFSGSKSRTFEDSKETRLTSGERDRCKGTNAQKSYI